MSDLKNKVLDNELQSAWGKSLASSVAEAGEVQFTNAHKRQIIEQSNQIKRTSFSWKLAPLAGALAVLLLMFNFKQVEMSTEYAFSTNDEVELEMFLYGEAEIGADSQDIEDQFETDLNIDLNLD